MHSSNEFLHPLWLGILILFNVILLIGIFCCLRRKYASRFCRDNQNDEQIGAPSSSPLSNWRNVYIPPSSLPRRSPSPKLYTLIKTMKTAATHKEQQRAEVARKFYASMRHANQSEETIDIETMPSDQDENLQLFRTPRFFQSIADSTS